MAEDKNDELARLLGAMADGSETDEPSEESAPQPQEGASDPLMQSSPAASPPPKPAGAANPGFTPRPAPPRVGGAPIPRPAGMKAAPVRNSPKPIPPPLETPRRAAPAPPPPVRPAAPAEAAAGSPAPADAISNDVAAANDDAVFIPTSPPSYSAPRLPVPIHKGHFVQSIKFRQTTVPILLTMGLICLMTAFMGYVVDDSSPFHGLRSGGLVVSLLALSAGFWGFGVMTMLSLRKRY
jgi:hypothetical protein